MNIHLLSWRAQFPRMISLRYANYFENKNIAVSVKSDRFFACFCLVCVFIKGYIHRSEKRLFCSLWLDGLMSGWMSVDAWWNWTWCKYWLEELIGLLTSIISHKHISSSIFVYPVIQLSNLIFASASAKHCCSWWTGWLCPASDRALLQCRQRRATLLEKKFNI